MRTLAWYGGRGRLREWKERGITPAAAIKRDVENMARIPLNDVMFFWAGEEILETLVDECARYRIGVHPMVPWKEWIRESAPEETWQRRISDPEGYRKMFGIEFRAGGFCSSCLEFTDKTDSLEMLDDFCRRYGSGIAGIHYDRYRYMNTYMSMDFPCECLSCQRHRKKWLGRGVFTEEDRGNPAVMYKEISFKNKVLTDYFREIHPVVKRRGLEMSLAARSVYLELDTEYNYLPGPAGYGPAVFEGQDWPEWFNEGLLDFVCPMNYSTSLDRVRRITAQHIMLLANNTDALFEGLAVESSAGSNCPGDLAGQIGMLKDLGLKGFALHDWSAVTDSHIKTIRDAV